VRAVKWILYGDRAFSVNFPIDALIDSNDPIYLVVLPKRVGIVIRKVFKDLVVIDPIFNADFCRAAFEFVVDLELFDLGLL
jgi:hypothetical protein